MTIMVEPKAIAEVRDQMLQAIKDVDGYLDQLEVAFEKLRKS